MRFRRNAPFVVLLASVLLIYVALVERGDIPASAAHADLPSPWAGSLSCQSPPVSDGDTFRCGKHRIRLAGIDTPEMPGHCRKGRKCTPGDPFAAKQALQNLVRGPVLCTPIEKDRYGRIVARCQAGGRDVSCAMLDMGHAVKRYRALKCT